MESSNVQIGRITMALGVTWLCLVWGLIILIPNASGRGFTNRGTTFFVAYAGTNNKGQEEKQDVELFIMNSVSVSVTVTVSAPRFTGYELLATRTVPKENYVMLIFNNTIRLEGIENAPKVILVESSDDIVVIAVNRELYSNDAFLALPEGALGTEYYSVSYYPSGWPTQFVVIGTQDQTDVQILLSDNPDAWYLKYNGDWYGPGDTISLSVNKFDAVQIQGSGDLSGSFVRSNKPIGFLSGNERTAVGTGTSSDHLIEYLPSVEKWGTRFATVPTPKRIIIEDYYKIIASENSTVVDVACADEYGNITNMVSNLRRAGDFELLSIESGMYCSFESNYGILVAQIVLSRNKTVKKDKHDPAMILITPIQQYESEYRFTTPKFSKGSYENFFMFVVTADKKFGLRVDNSALPPDTDYVSIPGTDLVGGYVVVSDGYHAIYHTSANVVFAGFLYGRALWETYGIPAGTRLADVNRPCSLSTSVPGDVIDNDCDGLIDEELDNQIDDDGDGQIDEDCAITTYPVDGNWVDWSGWGACSVTCTSDATPSGVRKRYRTCTNPNPKYDGENCAGSAVESLICTPAPCPPVDGNWAVWTPWSNCTGCVASMTPTTGNQTRTRTCTDPAPRFGGNPCPSADPDEEVIACPCPIDGNWADWEAWGDCFCPSGSSPSSTRTRLRTCTNPSTQYGGAGCGVYNNETEVCSCPVDGNWAVWGSWSACSMTCNPGSDLIIMGTERRSRTCSDPAPQNGGNPCNGIDTDTHHCQQTTLCPGVQRIDGTWNTWSSWTGCRRMRFRHCDNPAPSDTGLDCVGNYNTSTSCESGTTPGAATTTATTRTSPRGQCSCPTARQKMTTPASSSSTPTPASPRPTPAPASPRPTPAPASTGKTSRNLPEILQELKVQLRLNRKSLSKYKSSLTSAPDVRGSSALMGCVMIGVLCSIMLTVAVIDVNNLITYFRYSRQ